MKKFILIAVALMMTASLAYAVGGEGDYLNRKISSGGSASDPVREYKLMRFAENGQDGTSISAGELVFLDCVSDDGVTINRLNTSTGSNDAVVGVAVDTILTADNYGTAAQTLGGRNWGYVCVGGPIDAMVKATTVAGGALIASNDTTNKGYAEPFASGAPHRAGSLFGYALDAVTSSANDCEIVVTRR
jgi:hypothetical protein